MKAKNGQSFSMDSFSGNGMKQMEDMMSMGKQSTDAWMKFGSIFSQGMGEMMSICMTKAKTANEKNANAWKSMMGCKTVNEFAEMQNRMAQESFEEAMSTSAQVSEMTVKVMMDAFEPLNKQMSQAMKKANVMAA